MVNDDTNARVAVFAGSFDPYTIGHDNILRRALPLFDKIVIGIGVNERKQYMLTADERLDNISKIYASETKVEVKTYNDLTIDFAKRVGAQYIIKGVRSVKDFEYEREQADINRQLSGIETLLLYAEPQYANISSSLVRELRHFGRNADEFLVKA